MHFQLSFLVYLWPQDLVSIHTTEPHRGDILSPSSSSSSTLSPLPFYLLLSSLLHIQVLNNKTSTFVPFPVFSFLSCSPLPLFMTHCSLFSIYHPVNTVKFCRTFEQCYLVLRLQRYSGTLTHLLLPASALFSVHQSKSLSFFESASSLNNLCIHVCTFHTDSEMTA